MLTYHDHTSGRTRLKPRYKYSVIAFALGVAVGAMLSALL